MLKALAVFASLAVAVTWLVYNPPAGCGSWPGEPLVCHGGAVPPAWYTGAWKAVP